MELLEGMAMTEIEALPGGGIDVDLGHGVHLTGEDREAVAAEYAAHLRGENAWRAMSEGARWCETKTMLRVLDDADETRGE